MLLVACFFLALLTVPLARGRLMALADVALPKGWALAAALFLQVVIISLVPEGSKVFHEVAHVGSYVLVAVFIVANRRMPGLWLVCLGGAMNLAAITANGGVMPATAAALETAGRQVVEGQFANSTVLADPKLLFLGDVFALPAPLPLANVFSAGDVCLVLGIGMVMHQICGSKWAPKTDEEEAPRPLERAGARE